MTIKELLEKSELVPVSIADPSREISDVYIGDLLSWVMGRAVPDSLWVTIMSNLNIVAVASLIDFSAIILAEGVTLDAEVLSVAEDKGINIISSPHSAYETALILGKLLK